MPSLKIFVTEDVGSVEEIVVVTWLKREGDAVKEGEELVIIQSEKISIEVFAPADGILTSILVQQGDVAPVDQPLAEFEVTQTEAVAAPDLIQAKSEPTSEAAPPVRDIRASPIAKRLARQNSIDLGEVEGSGKGGRITEKDVQTFLEKKEMAVVAPVSPDPPSLDKEIRASPIARRIANDHQIDLRQIPGAGEKRLTRKDVQAFIENKGQRDPVLTGQPQPVGQTFPMAGMRAAIAQRMHQSLQEMAQLTLHTEADVTELVTLRRRLKETLPVTYTDLLVWASVKALQGHPHLNATLKDGSIHLLTEINVGLAVALESGLVVPVIKDADQLSLVDLTGERARLVERARENKLTMADLSGGTFTITNLGTYDIDGFTPIVNPPEVAILGVGRIVEKVVIYQGKIAQRSMLTLSLSFDHRLVDGAPAAAFLQTIKRHLEDPSDLAYFSKS
ncbi:MAG: dihydrolipoamide acetyltransferase family protein [Chloroflexota bacterium]